MFIAYFIHLGQTYGVCAHFPSHHLEDTIKVMIGPSECVWLVPGSAG